MIFTGEVRVVSEAAHDRRGTMHATIEVTPGRVYVRSSESPSCTLHFSVVVPPIPSTSHASCCSRRFPPFRPVSLSLSLRARVSRLLFSFSTFTLSPGPSSSRAHTHAPAAPRRTTIGRRRRSGNKRNCVVLRRSPPSCRATVRAHVRRFSANTEQHRLMYPTRCITTDSHAAVAATLIIIGGLLAARSAAAVHEIVNADSSSVTSHCCAVRTLCTRVFNGATLHHRRSVTD